jgi:hypothetical protein
VFNEFRRDSNLHHHPSRTARLNSKGFSNLNFNLLRHRQPFAALLTGKFFPSMLFATWIQGSSNHDSPTFTYGPMWLWRLRRNFLVPAAQLSYGATTSTRTDPRAPATGLTARAQPHINFFPTLAETKRQNSKRAGATSPPSFNIHCTTADSIRISFSPWQSSARPRRSRTRSRI